MTSSAIYLAIYAGWLAFVTNAAATGSEIYCLTPNGEPGHCLTIPNCPHLRTIRQHLPEHAQPHVHEYLFQSQCSVDGAKLMKFCCVARYREAEEIAKLQVKYTTERPVEVTTSGVLRSAPLRADSHVTTPPRVSTADSLLTHPHRRWLPQENCGSALGVADRDQQSTRTAQLGEHPWAVLLQYERYDGRASDILCGGALLSDRYVLTSARCTSSGNPYGHKLVSVRVGEYDVEADPDCKDESDGEEDDMFCLDNAVEVTVESEIVHPGYLGAADKSRNHDLALLRLRPHVLSNYDVKPICLPVDDDVVARHLEGDFTDLYVAGWGARMPVKGGSAQRDVRTSKLTTGHTSVTNHTTCSSYFAPRHIRVSSSQLCAVDKSPRRNNTCVMDDGGVAVSRHVDADGRARLYVTGMVSFNLDRCYVEEEPLVMTRVAAYSRWILDQLMP